MIENQIRSKILWCNEIALEIERIIGTQDVIPCNNFFESWNKGYAGFEQSSTDNLSPGKGVVRRPGDKVITFVPGLGCASSRKMWVNRLCDYKDDIYGGNFDIGRITVKSGQREVVVQIGSLPIKLRWLECLMEHGYTNQISQPHHNFCWLKLLTRNEKWKIEKKMIEYSVIFKYLW